MSKSRCTFSAEFKAKVALEATQGRSSMGELSKKYDLYPHLIAVWKNELIAKAVSVFSEGQSGVDGRSTLNFYRFCCTENGE